jgi:hypothetical protein
VAALALGLLVQSPAIALQGTVIQAEAATAKKGLVKVKKKYYFYAKGKKVKNKWKKVKVKGTSYKYYFGKNGAAYTGLKKVKGKTYYFNAKGQMQTECWYKKTYYLGTDGVAVTGIKVIDGTMYQFAANGKLDSAKSQELQANSVQGADATALKSILGEPISAEYAGSCMTYEGQSGEDGIWTYDGFTIYTFRYGDKEIVWTCF